MASPRPDQRSAFANDEASDMPAPIRRLLNDFGFGDRTQLDAVAASLLRHLCDAPGLHAVLHVGLCRGSRTTRSAAVARLKAQMTQEASILAPHSPLAAPRGKPGSVHDNRRIYEQSATADDGDRLCTEASAH